MVLLGNPSEGTTDCPATAVAGGEAPQAAQYRGAVVGLIEEAPHLWAERRGPRGGG